MQGQVIVMSPDQLESYVNQLFEKAANRLTLPPPVPTAQNDTDELITRQDAAKILKVKSLVTIDNLSKKGLLKKHRLGGGVVRFKRGEVIAFSQTKNTKR